MLTKEEKAASELSGLSLKKHYKKANTIQPEIDSRRPPSLHTVRRTPVLTATNHKKAPGVDESDSSLKHAAESRAELSDFKPSWQRGDCSVTFGWYITAVQFSISIRLHHSTNQVHERTRTETTIQGSRGFPCDPRSLQPRTRQTSHVRPSCTDLTYPWHGPTLYSLRCRIIVASS